MSDATYNRLMRRWAAGGTERVRARHAIEDILAGPPSEVADIIVNRAEDDFPGLDVDAARGAGEEARARSVRRDVLGALVEAGAAGPEELLAHHLPGKHDQRAHGRRYTTGPSGKRQPVPGKGDVPHAPKPEPKARVITPKPAPQAPTHTKAELDRMTPKELKALGERLGIPGAKRMSRKNLYDNLLVRAKREEPPPEPAQPAPRATPVPAPPPTPHPAQPKPESLPPVKSGDVHGAADAMHGEAEQVFGRYKVSGDLAPGHTLEQRLYAMGSADVESFDKLVDDSAFHKKAAEGGVPFFHNEYFRRLMTIYPEWKRNNDSPYGASAGDAEHAIKQLDNVRRRIIKEAVPVLRIAGEHAKADFYERHAPRVIDSLKEHIRSGGKTTPEAAPAVAPKAAPTSARGRVQGDAPSVRVKTAVEHVDRLGRLTGGLVHLGTLRTSLGNLTDAEFRQVVETGRRQGVLSLSAAEGRHGVSEYDKKHALYEVDPVTGRPDSMLLYASVKPHPFAHEIPDIRL